MNPALSTSACLVHQANDFRRLRMVDGPVNLIAGESRWCTVLRQFVQPSGGTSLGSVGRRMQYELAAKIARVSLRIRRSTTIEGDIHLVVVVRRVRQEPYSGPELTHTNGEVAGIQVLFPFRPLAGSTI